MLRFMHKSVNICNRKRRWGTDWPVSETHLLRTKSGISSVRSTSGRRMYGASVSQVRVKYEVDMKNYSVWCFFRS